MDIAKYIGQFILKNNFCYIHGLGNMELVKRPAVHDGKSLLGPTYEVIVTAGGSIDDSFANFIATNEQISISKAANALRDFSMQSRKDMQAGKEVAIPGIGKFTEEGGKVKFHTDASFKFTPAGMPTLKNSKQLEQQKVTPVHKPSFPPPAPANSVNWSMVIIAGILVVILAAGGYGFYYYKSQQSVVTAPVQLPPKDTVIAPPTVVAPDTTRKDTVMAAPAAVVDTNAINPYKMIVGDFHEKGKADKRFRQLKIIGYKVEMVTKDSVNFQVIADVSCRVVDTTHFKDSLSRIFGYKNIMIVK